MEGPTRNSACVVSTSTCANSVHYLARRAAREGQKKYSLWRDATFEKDFDSCRECGRFAGSWSRNDSQRSVPEGCGLELLSVEFSMSSEHKNDSKYGVRQSQRRGAAVWVPQEWVTFGKALILD